MKKNIRICFVSVISVPEIACSTLLANKANGDRTQAPLSSAQTQQTLYLEFNKP